MPRTEEQFHEIREQKARLILHTALELFADEGYYTISISRIADKAGISKGLMYHYFKSKEELVLEIIGEGIRQLSESLDPDHDGILTVDEFEYFINETFSILQSNIDYWKLYFSTMMQPAVFSLVKEKYPTFLTSLIKIIEGHFIRKGAKEPALEAIYLDSLLYGIFLNYVLAPEKYPLQEMKKLVLERFK